MNNEINDSNTVSNDSNVTLDKD